MEKAEKETVLIVDDEVELRLFCEGHVRRDGKSRGVRYVGILGVGCNSRPRLRVAEFVMRIPIADPRIS